MQALSGIIKKHQVREAGAPLQSQAPPNGPSARIIDQRDGQTVIEVTCECGKKIQLVCEK